MFSYGKASKEKFKSHCANLIVSQGFLPAAWIIENIMDHIAEVLGKDPTEVRKLNLFQEGQVSTPSFIVNPSQNIICSEVPDACKLLDICV